MSTERKTFTVPAAEIRAELAVLDKERARLKRVLKLAEEEEAAHGATSALELETAVEKFCATEEGRVMFNQEAAALDVSERKAARNRAQGGGA